MPRTDTILCRWLQVMLALGCLCACKQQTVYHYYRETPVDGWGQNDTLIFRIDTVRTDGNYRMNIGLRTTNMYPYRTLWLLVEGSLQNPQEHFTDTLVCRLTDNDGDINGRGINTYQYLYPLTHLPLKAGQSGTLQVRHLMRRDVLPGVSDIGVEITR